MLFDYDLMWMEEYRREQLLLTKALKAFITKIHHVGSTAVYGLSARPIIDISAECSVYPPTEKIIAVLRLLDYRPNFNDDRFGYSFFKERELSVCLYWRDKGSREVIEELCFRDLLRSQPQIRQRYEMIKRSLILRYHYDFLAYQEHKAAVIEAILKTEGKLIE